MEEILKKQAKAVEKKVLGYLWKNYKRDPLQVAVDAKKEGKERVPMAEVQSEKRAALHAFRVLAQ